MVGSKGKGKAPASKLNCKNLSVVGAEHEPLKISTGSTEKSSHDPLDGEEENNDISNEGENSAGEEKKEEIGPMLGNGHEEEQLANQVNDEEKDAVNDVNVDQSEDVAECRRTVDMSEEVSFGVAAANVAENEVKINEVVPGGDRERIQESFSDEGIETGVEIKNSEIAAEGNTSNEGLHASDHRIMEEKLADSMQDKEANKLNAEEQGTPTATDNEKIECKGEDTSIPNDVKSVIPKVDRPRRKVLKKKVIKKKMVVGDDGTPKNEAKSQSLIGEKASSKEMKTPEVTAEGSTNVNQGLSASEHGIMEENLADATRNEEANKVNAKEPTSTHTPGKIARAGEKTSIANEIELITEKVDIPKGQVLKKKVVKKKMVVQDHVALVDEAKVQSSLGGEVSGKADKADANKDEEKSVLTENGNIELTADIADNAKADSEKVSGPKPDIVKKKFVKKVVQGDVSSVHEARPQCSSENDASGEANEADENKGVKNEDKLEAKPAIRVNKKRKRIRKKKVPETRADLATAAGEQKPRVTINDAEGQENKETDVRDVKNEEATKSENRSSQLKKRKKKRMVREDTRKVVVDAIDTPGPSEKGKSSKRVDGMGMIFMCSSETKKDCYRYKVLGLPASKKNIVSKIYKGMRLFLFDIDLRMMYGIYKAAGPGGYNIEPKAFRSQFPSQVRFTVLNDCLPLVEEKFKSAIKDNYYTKNKFNCQLTTEQVKNLCKLFTGTSRRAESKPSARTQIPAAPSSSHQDRKRKLAEDSRKARPIESRKAGRIDNRETRHISSLELERSRREARHISPIELERSRIRAHEEVRRTPVVIDDRYQYHRPVVYEREAYHPPVPTSAVYQHLPSQNPPHPSSYSYDYEEASREDIDIYRRDPALDRRRLELPSSRDWERSVAAPRTLDPYVPYRETHSYRDPVYETSARHEAGYETSLRSTEYYTATDYRAPLPPYRRY